MHELAPPPEHLRLGLRFDRRDAKRLRDIADINIANPDFDASLFHNAAAATERGEPLIVLCSDVDEAMELAYVFPQLGIERPVIEEPNG